MPKSAMREVKVDYCAPVAEIGAIITNLVSEPAAGNGRIDMKEDEKVKTEIRIAAEDSAFESGVFKLGDLSPFTCPDCHGVLLRLKDGNFVRYRCHTGHAYSADALLTSITETVEESIWNAVRTMEENVMLLQHFGKHLAETGQQELSEAYFAKAHEAENRIHLMRQAAMQHEKLNTEKINQQITAE